MWQSKFRHLQFFSPRRILQQKHYAKSMKSTSATLLEQQTDAEKLGKLTTSTNILTPEPIKTGPYLAKNPKTTLINPEEHQTVSFDDIPGPMSLRFISKFWSMVPVMETEIIIRVAQYFLSGGKFFRGILSWGGHTSFFKKFFSEYGPVVRIHGAFGSDVVLLSRPEHACAIFRSEGQYPIRSCLDSVEKYRLECRNYRQAGPFLAYGPDWEKVRKSLEEPMQATLTEQYDKLQKICDELVERIIVIRNKQEEMPNNFDVEIFKWSLECLSAVTLNKKLGFLDPCGVSPTSDPGRLLEGLFGATDAIRKCEYAFHFWKFVKTPAWKSLVVYWISPPANGWETPSPHQYHIQTDEGPERYFRYQTDSGQYRKEKRLEDGTVVGTYAWIDADGIMRQRDYIADSAGYRILKSKNVYVGRNANVGEAIKAAKKYPASAGTLVQPNQRPVITVPYSAPVPSSTYGPSSPISQYLPSTTAAPIVSTTSTSYVDVSPNSFLPSTPYGVVSSTEAPVVEITPNSYLLPSPTPLQNLEPPVNFTFLSNNYLPSSPSPFSVSTEYVATPAPTGQYIPPVVTSTERPYYPSVVPTTPSPQYTPALYNNLPQSYGDIDHNSLDYNPNVRQVNDNYRFQNGPTYPIDKNGKPYRGQNLGNGYDPQYPAYDGVSVTNDGFRYYIPRAYHEEQTQPGEKRSGSFGYIDPFGIRRVIYYNTAPGSGFQHRKNNRYVGFQATPYDPRPY